MDVFCDTFSKNSYEKCYSRGVARGGFQGFRNPPSRVKEPPPPPLLFLGVILSQQECNGLSVPEILRFVLSLQ